MNTVSGENILTHQEVKEFSELSEQGKVKSGLELQMLLDKTRKTNTGIFLSNTGTDICSEVIQLGKHL